MKKRVHSSRDVATTVSLFFAVRRIMRTTLAKRAGVDPATWPRIETLQFIADHTAPQMKEVAEHLSITAPSATTLVNSLVKRGLVAHRVDASDRRSTRLILTKKGKAELKYVVTRGTRLLGGLFDTLSPKELILFTKLLTRLKQEAPK